MQDCKVVLERQKFVFAKNSTLWIAFSQLHVPSIPYSTLGSGFYAVFQNTRDEYVSLWTLNSSIQVGRKIIWTNKEAEKDEFDELNHVWKEAAYASCKYLNNSKTSVKDGFCT